MQGEFVWEFLAACLEKIFLRACWRFQAQSSHKSIDKSVTNPPGNQLQNRAQNPLENPLQNPARKSAMKTCGCWTLHMFIETCTFQKLWLPKCCNCLVPPLSPVLDVGHEPNKHCRMQNSKENLPRKCALTLCELWGPIEIQGVKESLLNPVAVLSCGGQGLLRGTQTPRETMSSKRLRSQWSHVSLTHVVWDACLRLTSHCFVDCITPLRSLPHRKDTHGSVSITKIARSRPLGTVWRSVASNTVHLTSTLLQNRVGTTKDIHEFWIPPRKSSKVVQTSWAFISWVKKNNARFSANSPREFARGSQKTSPNSFVSVDLRHGKLHRTFWKPRWVLVQGPLKHPPRRIFVWTLCTEPRTELFRTLWDNPQWGS